MTVEVKIKLTMEDVWGNDSHTGMIVASYGQKCPVFNDAVPYKSVTVVFDKNDEKEVTHWLSYVHGGGYSKRKTIGRGKVAIRSDYQCW